MPVQTAAAMAPVQKIRSWRICRDAGHGGVVLNFTTLTGHEIALALPESDFNATVDALQDHEIEAFSVGMGTH